MLERLCLTARSRNRDGEAINPRTACPAASAVVYKKAIILAILNTVKNVPMSSSRNFHDESFVKIEPVPQNTVGCVAASHGRAVRLRRHIFFTCMCTVRVLFSSSHNHLKNDPMLGASSGRRLVTNASCVDVWCPRRVLDDQQDEHGDSRATSS